MEIIMEILKTIGFVILFLLGQLAIFALFGEMAQRDYRRKTGRLDFWKHK